MLKSKSVTHSLSDWQCHLLSCPGQLKKCQSSAVKIFWAAWSRLSVPGAQCGVNYEYIWTFFGAWMHILAVGCAVCTLPLIMSRAIHYSELEVQRGQPVHISNLISSNEAALPTHPPTTKPYRTNCTSPKNFVEMFPMLCNRNSLTCNVRVIKCTLFI